MALSSSESAVFGTIRSGSKNICVPSPSQVGHAPYGLLNENSRGSISDKVKPLTGQANLEDIVKVSGVR